jgi:tetratricopeptide (TPR) repeat protein
MLLAAFLPLIAAASAPPTMEQTKLAVCLEQANKDPTTAIVTASGWLGEAAGADRALPQQCLGIADTLLQRWKQAEDAFLTGRGFAAENDHELRARLAAMAGNAALADGRAEAALVDLDLALTDAKAAGDTQIAGGVQLDRSRALVALGKLDEASAALAEARTETPKDSEAWLLSATLARRMKNLAQAQEWIETATKLAPHDPQIGLEAGVIAALGGRDDAARKSWQSVIEMSPNSPEAKTARGYLDQIDPAGQDSGK